MNPEIERVLANPDNLIMSDELSDLLGVEIGVEPVLKLDGVPFVCKISSAKLLASLAKEWEFELEVPSLDLADVIKIPEVVFEYGDAVFSEMQSLEMICGDDSKFLILVLREIIIDEEESDDG